MVLVPAHLVVAGLNVARVLSVGGALLLRVLATILTVEGLTVFDALDVGEGLLLVLAALVTLRATLRRLVTLLVLVALAAFTALLVPRLPRVGQEL